MRKLIDGIFQELRHELPETKSAEERISQEVEKLLLDCKKELSDQDYEKVRDLIFSAALVAEEGFRLEIQWFRYGGPVVIVMSSKSMSYF